MASQGPASSSHGAGPNDGGDAERVRKRLRARASWFKAAEQVTKKIRIEKIASNLTGIPRGTPRSLCEKCASLDLKAEKFKVENRVAFQPQRNSSIPQHTQEMGKFEIGSGRGPYELGTLGRIRERSDRCPFCSLIWLSVQEQTDEDLSEDESILGHNCYASWQLDGREIIQGDNKTTSTQARTRRIRLEWSGDHLQDSYIVLLPDQHWAQDSLFMGRHVESSRTNLSLIKSWIDLCHKNHGPLCEVRHGEEFDELRKKPYFGVVDVQEMRLRELPQDARYIALSYTWGDDGSRFTTTRANVDRLGQRDGIKDVLDQIPLALKDAITLVRNLGERYLWVDSLCIVQDSQDSWKLNANIMDRVYGHAYLTICAADDPDATAGLVGLDPTRRRFTQHIEEYASGVNLMVSQLSESYIRRSRWNTRAWTFQERLLSRRCLLFTRGRVYFQCRSTAMSEDIIAENDAAGWSIELAHAPLQMLTELETRALRVYTQCVELYTKRRLSRNEDILSAFNGITNLVGSALGADFIHGLPNSHFDWALLWEPDAILRRRAPPRTITANGRKKPAKQIFPSWSWCGWIGTTHYKYSSIVGTLANLHDWLMNRTWIVWYIRDGHGALRLVARHGDKQQGKRQAREHRWEGYDTSSANDTQHSDPYGRLRRSDVEHGDTFKRTLPDFPFGLSKADPAARPDPMFSDMRFLQFWTWSAYFRLTHEEHRAPSSEGRLKRFGITDCKGDWCGTIILDKKLKGDLNPEAEHAFIAISEAKEFSKDECANWTYYIPTERDQSEWYLYYVLLIEYDEGTKIASRVGLGKIYKEAFFNSCDPGRHWKEFILG